MTTNKFDNLLSSKQTEETVIEKMLRNKSITKEEMSKELELEGFSQTDFSEALLTYVEYSTENFVKPQKFTKSYKNDDILFTNYVNIRLNNDYLLENINLLQEDIVKLLPKLEIINKSRHNDSRLLEICEFYSWDLSNDVDPESHNLYKFEGKTKRISGGSHTNTFRVFVGIENIVGKNKKIRLLFIDPYHLAVPARHRYNPQARVRGGKEMLESTYVSCRYYPHELYQLIDYKINNK